MAKKQSGEGGAVAPKELPITLRAMLAADVSSLPSALKHLIHVLALHATNSTGRGLTGQAALAHYMGVSRRHIGRLWAELDARWNDGTSPVAAHREARWHSSDAYQLEVRIGAPLQLERTFKTGKATIAQVDVTTEGGQCALGDTSIGHPGRTNYAETLGASTQRVSVGDVATGGLGGRGAPIGDDLPYDPTPEEARAYLEGAGDRAEWFARRSRLLEVAARRWPVTYAEGEALPEPRRNARRSGMVRCVLGEIRPPKA